VSALALRGLSKRFAATAALTGLDLAVAPGSRTAVVGPSGSGKTTLLRLIAGFEAPDAGEIVIDGELVANREAGVPAHRRNVGLVMQEGALFPHLSVLENIRFGLRGRADGRDVALALMDVVELDRALAERQPHQLSGGQQQRVALARALARRPRLMLLDEPFSALDTALRDGLRAATMRILAQAGIATLLVTHDQREAMGFGEQLVVLRDGRLVQAGRPRDLYLAPADPAAALFLGPAVILDAEIVGSVAHSPLGPLPCGPAPPQGRATIMLRPEQLRLAPGAGSGADAWQLAEVEVVGPAARVCLRRNEGAATLRFETPARDVPAAGTPVRVTVSGEAHAFRPAAAGG
jgi:iron(III) transport system ATP-binding protein